jgi:hypothetical protein
MRNLLIISTVLLLCGACGGSSGDPGTAVKMQPLAGTIKGKSFSAVSALARAGGSMTGRQITIYPKMTACTDPGTLNDGDQQILLNVDPWTAGSSYQLNLDLTNLANAKTVTFVVEQGMTPNNYIVGSGRVEVQQTGMNAMLGLRATDSSYGSVEGTIAVTECP